MQLILIERNSTNNFDPSCICYDNIHILTSKWFCEFAKETFFQDFLENGVQKIINETTVIVMFVADSTSPVQYLVTVSLSLNDSISLA